MTSDLRTRPLPTGKRDREGRFEFEPHRCFACGELNESGLRLQLHTSPEGAWTELVLEPRFQGWDQVVHGGIVCTILDEVMAWAVIGSGTWGVTARLNVAFRRPIRTGQRIRAEGWVVDEGRRSARAARAEGHVLDAATGQVLATGESTFVAVPSAQLAELQVRYGMRRIADGEERASETTEGVDERAEPAAAMERETAAAPGSRG